MPVVSQEAIEAFQDYGGAHAKALTCSALYFIFLSEVSTRDACSMQAFLRLVHGSLGAGSEIEQMPSSPQHRPYEWI
ncbi:MAG TPA: hypothetical protein VLQ80_23045, partial [Candidatus Saccharimonadia bacterium]|nr:hypothetical protein [Candidatus Saccharimonadia bacterium]